MNINQNIPNLRFETTDGSQCFNDYLGSWLILYFYPKDATPGCTTEACDFRDHEKQLSINNTKILGVSRDSLSSHEKFIAKQSLPFNLISDTDEALCQAFDVIKQKNMYGKLVRGIERSTFIIDPNGVVQFVWRKVRAKGHVETVLKQLNILQQ